MNKGLVIEAEEFGMLAVFGVLLVPGAWWVSRAKSGKGAAVRAVLVGAFLVSAAVVEGKMDQATNKITDTE